MTNVTVQEALKAAEKLIVKAIMFESEAEQYLSESNYELNGCLGDSAADISVNGKAVLAKVRAALAEINRCEPVAEAIRERDRLGFAVVNVIGKLDEIIENTQEVEVDDFLHIAVPIDMWNELQDALEDMPKRADLYTSPQPIEKCEPVGELILDPVFLPALKAPLVNWKINLVDLEVGTKFYTSPQPREWVDLSDSEWVNIVNHDHGYENFSKDDAVHEAVKMTEIKLKQLNTKG